MSLAFPHPKLISTSGRRLAAAAWRRALAAVAVAAATSQLCQAAISERQWAVAPTRIAVTLAVDDAARPAAGLESRLVQEIKRRLAAAVFPVWQPRVVVPPAGEARRKALLPDELKGSPANEGDASVDKQLWLAVHGTPAGYEVVCREYDKLLRRWSLPQRRFVRQESYLADGCAQLLLDSCSPVARVALGATKDDVATVTFRGAELPGVDSRAPLFKGQPLAVLVSRFDPRGEPINEPAAPLPWTYLVATERDGAAWKTHVVSAQRSALVTRRRGFTELLAIPLPREPMPVWLRLHPRRDSAKGLAGIEVFRLTGAAPERLGVTGKGGTFVVPPGPEPISTLLLRSDGVLLAKVPVAAGVEGTVDVPLPYDLARTRAHAAAQGIREELVDLVARRAILMARIKGTLKKNREKEAKELMEELSGLPTASTFSRDLDNAQQRVGGSDDPLIQKAIEQEFADAHELLAKFLDARPITELQYQVNMAGAEPANEPPPAAEPTGDKPPANDS